jgi:S-DNA-T family DNA segregation ATPase FtsK/SpoIIIE
MFENRNRKIDLVALVLACLTLFLGVSLLSYDPADPVAKHIGLLAYVYQPDVLVYPQNEHLHNACGRFGALAADVLLSGLGVGAYYFVFSLGVLVFSLLKQIEIDQPLQRGLGWGLSLWGGTTLITALAPSYSPGPVIGAGGYLGKLGEVLLEMHFAATGELILATCVTIAGLMLSTDYTLLKLTLQFFGFMSAGAEIVKAKLPKRTARETRNAKSRDDLPPPPTAVNPNEPYAIRIHGKQRDEEEDELEEEYEDDEYEEDEEDEEAFEDDTEEVPAEEEVAAPAAAKVLSLANTLPEAAVPAVAAKAAQEAVAALKIKNPNDKKKEFEEERAKVKSQLDQATTVTVSTESDYELPSVELLQKGEDIDFEEQAKEVRRKAKLIEKTFLDFGFKVKVVEIETGPVIAQYEVELEPGLRLSKITALADDLAIALRVPSVRIVAPIPGKNSVGIEVPNEARQTVRMREVIEESNAKIKKMRIPLFLGKDVSGNPLLADLSALPHLLIAGSTGTGKSVCLNTIISSILMTRRPDEVRMLMIDPKLVELSGYSRLPHLMHPVVTDMRKAEAILNWGVEKMEERYALLARAGVRHISVYNQLGEDELMERFQPEDEEQKKAIPLNLPFIVIVVDEFADLMMQCGKEVEQHIIRLAQKSRAVGIHLILATQKPTVDVITGLIKSNLPARICFKVTNRTDSRVVLDEMGAEKLLGMGDMLFLTPGTSQLLRGQGTYLGDDEINTVVDFVSTCEQNFVTELVSLKPKDEAGGGVNAESIKKRDPLYENAVEVVVQEGRGSVSLLQRVLGIGYGRAARLIDFMAEDGIVGHYAGSQAREVQISMEDWQRMKNDTGEENAKPGKGGKSRKNATPPAPPPITPTHASVSVPSTKRSNKVVPEPWEEEEDDSAAPEMHEDDAAEEEIDFQAAEDGSEDEFAESYDELANDYDDEQRESA